MEEVKGPEIKMKANIGCDFFMKAKM